MSLKFLKSLPGKLLALPVIFYRKWISPYTPARCRFHPTCSEYTLYCLTHLPIYQAIPLSIWRIFRCQPLFPGGIDYPPGYQVDHVSQSPVLDEQENKDRRNLMKEITFIMIKPDAVEDKHTGAIIERIEKEGFEIKALKKVRLSKKQAEEFYAVHKDRPFYGELTEFMSSGPVVAAALERENAVAHWRKVIGATDPAEAEEGTIRKLYARSKGENAVHGSDSVENGKLETSFFFSGLELN